jgi:muramidase (phage lysozyme)
MTTNRQAFLDMIAHSEIGPDLLAVSDNGYDVLVGSTANAPLLFKSYADHPRVLNRKLDSTAAGRYQLLARYFDAYKRRMMLPDFSPASQDEIALQQIKECDALHDVDTGWFDDAGEKCAHIWASLPGAGYGQHENKIEDLRAVYLKAGGVFVSEGSYA